MTVPPNQEQSPLVVIGSGVAGLLAARIVADFQPVILITKRNLIDSNTEQSQGGIAAVWSEKDSPELHTSDTLKAGNEICDVKAVSVLTSHGHDAILKLIELGVRFDKDENGNYLLGLEGAHSIPRILHAGGDATGAEIQRALISTVRKHPSITILHHSFATEIITESGEVSGVRYYDPENNEKIIPCKQAILATGGAGTIYRYSSNPETATGEGLILAYLAGADLTDLEFYQFHPTALCLPGAPNFLISEAVRGEGAVLRNSKGEAFMEGVHPMKDLAPRDVVARAITDQINKTGQVFLDATGIGSAKLESRFPTIYRTCRGYGVDIRKEGIPITPVAHYMMGGVSSDLWGRTTVRGLYTSGEAARTGVHGSNRLASNSLLEGAVFSIRIAESILKDRQQVPEIWENTKDISTIKLPETPGCDLSLEELQKLMWKNAGLIRNEKDLQKLADALQDASYQFDEEFSPERFELFSMKLLGKLIAESALKRQESRGGHYREDYPETREELKITITQSIFNL